MGLNDTRLNKGVQARRDLAGAVFCRKLGDYWSPGGWNTTASVANINTLSKYVNSFWE